MSSGSPVAISSEAADVEPVGAPGLDAGQDPQRRMTAMTPIGTLTKKIQRQLALSRIRPPIVGPRIGASIAGTATMLMTRPMRLGPAASAIISWPIGRIMPPPTPWSTRKTISSRRRRGEPAQHRARR